MLMLYSTAQLNAQRDISTFIPISDQGRWYVNTTLIYANGDTIINGKSYIKIFTDEGYPVALPHYLFGIRSDATTQRVYGIYGTPQQVKDVDNNLLFTTSDTTELLLYDFSLQVGDSVTFYVFGRHISAEQSNILQEKGVRIDPSVTNDNYVPAFGDPVTVTADSVAHRNFYIQAKRGYPEYDVFNYTWIEGIGSLYGLYQPDIFQFLLNTHNFDCAVGWTYLLCYEENEVKLLNTHRDLIDDPDDCYAHVAPEDIMWGISDKTPPDIRLYPNPASDVIHVVCPESLILDNVNIDFYSILGEKLKSQHINGSSVTVSVNELPTGIYVVRFVQNATPIRQYKISIF